MSLPHIACDPTCFARLAARLWRGMAMLIYGDSRSGNCLKVKWTAARLGVPFEWREVDVMAGSTRTPGFLALNPAGQVPLVILEDGRPLAQSNAIILHLAEGSNLIPADPYDRAKVLEWLFWEKQRRGVRRHAAIR